jgi:KRAB domain-containing zinc finger protein
MLHNNSKPFRCTLCNWAFSEACKLNRHLQRIHHITKEIHNLTVTGNLNPADLQLMNTDDLQALNSPLGGQPLSQLHNADQVQCELCHKILNSAYALRRHMMVHTGQRPHQCPQCDKSFSECYKLKAHLMKAHGVSEDDATALSSTNTPHHGAQNVPVANTNSVDGESQAMYQNSLNSDTKPAVSDAANQDSDISTPKTGAREKESSENKCSVCFQNFASPYSLKRHQASHSGQKPFTCSVCGWGFLEPGRLRKHMKKSHPELEENALGASLAALGNHVGISPQLQTAYLQQLQQQQIRQLQEQHGLYAQQQQQQQRGLYPSQSGATSSPYFHGNSDMRPQAAPAPEKANGPPVCYCAACGSTFSNSSDLHKHMSTHQKTYSCHVCKLIFQQVSELQGHMQMHANIDVPCA